MGRSRQRHAVFPVKVIKVVFPDVLNISVKSQRPDFPYSRNMFRAD